MFISVLGNYVTLHTYMQNHKIKELKEKKKQIKICILVVSSNDVFPSYITCTQRLTVYSKAGAGKALENVCKEMVKNVCL